MKYKVVNKALVKSYQGRPCVLCGKGSNGHHIYPTSRVRIDEDWNLIELCFEHHRRLHDMGQNLFIEMNERYEEALIKKGWDYNRTTRKLYHPNTPTF